MRNMLALFAAVFVLTPVWNLRLLPFWYLGLILLAMLGAAELIRGVGELVARRFDPASEPLADCRRAPFEPCPGNRRSGCADTVGSRQKQV